MKMRVYRVTLFLLLCAGASCATGSAARAATVNLSPVADTMVSSAGPNNSYGSAGSFEVSAAGLTNGQFEALVRFDLSSAKSTFDADFGAGQWTVQSMVLELVAASPVNGIFNASAAGQLDIGWMQNDAWAEGTGTPMAPGDNGVTFNTLPSFLSAGDQSAGTFNFNGQTSGAVSYSLTLASGILGDASGGQLASLRLFAGDTMMSGLFNSQNFTTVSSRPILAVTAVAVPEPESWALAVMALAGAAVVVRCRVVNRSTI